MQVQLDAECWEMEDSVKLEEVIARISDMAHARGCLVTNLTVGSKVFTDRDLVPAVLSQEAGMFGKVVAVSQSLQVVMDGGADSAQRLAATLHDEGKALVRAFRNGEQRWRQLDGWLGQLADYVEWAELSRSVQASRAPHDSLVTWSRELVQARERTDIVALADLLEFEVLPRLPQSA